MQSTNVETVHRGFQAWADDDLEQFLATLDTEVEFQPSGVFPDFDSTYRGHDAVSQFWSRLQEPWKQLRLIPTRTEEHGDCVAVELEFLAVEAGKLIQNRRHSPGRLMHQRKDRDLGPAPWGQGA